MSCKFTWYNLPNQINKIIKPFTTTKVYWYNMPNTLTKVHKELLLLKPTCPQVPKFQWYALNQKAEAICELVNCLNTSPQYNFDVTSTNWGALTTANDWESKFIADGATFATITNFSNISGRIQFSISTDIPIIHLQNKNISNIGFVNIPNVFRIRFDNNNITKINNTWSLLPEIVRIDFPNNLFTISGYTQSETWANSLPNSINLHLSFLSNPDLPTGTNFRGIIINKGGTVQP